MSVYDIKKLVCPLPKFWAGYATGHRNLQVKRQTSPKCNLGRISSKAWARTTVVAANVLLELDAKPQDPSKSKTVPNSILKRCIL